MTLHTLFYPFETEELDWPEDGARILFINARQYTPLEKYTNLTQQQFFYPYANALQAHTNALPESQDYALVLLTKNKIESEHNIASALQSLKPGGLLIVSADNKAGGARLAKTLKSFGLTSISQLSKHKARVAWCIKENADNNKISGAIKNGQPQIKNDFHTWPGIYGWDKIDKGSQALTHHLPDDLKGHGADFGCGYGFLARHVLQNSEKVKSLTCIDADWRALECCKLNLEQHQNANFIWTDLTQPTTLKNLDFIIMNPPFHEGKTTNTSIGISFINTAHQALRKHGALYMVANNQLPYESALNNTFFKVEKIFEESGFKGFKAER